MLRAEEESIQQVQPSVSIGPCSLSWVDAFVFVPGDALLPKSNALVVPTPASFQLTKKPTSVTVPCSLFYQTSPPFPLLHFKQLSLNSLFLPSPLVFPSETRSHYVDQVNLRVTEIYLTLPPM